ncbi:MAG TPA: redox-sensing transcriptional repressor Rex [Spirochaetota bacterium]|nr:redox-sensing transcriptional repressor Rex [Spirochaetota bacterium]
MNESIPQPTLDRVCRIYNLLVEGSATGLRHISSQELGEKLGVPGTSIRKDLSLIGDPGNSGAKYDAARLKAHLEEKLGLGARRRACVVGIGKLGSAILEFGLFSIYGFDLAAGFDSSMNTIETRKTNVKLYPSFQIAEVVKREKIDLAFLCVPAAAAQSSAEKLAAGGIRGIINFTPVSIRIDTSKCFVTNVDVMKEMRMLSAMISLTHPANDELNTI